MSTRFLKSLSTFVAILALLPTAAAVPVPISSPTAIALIVYLSVVPASLILLLIVKYFYVKNRKADTASGRTLSSGSSPQLRTRHRLGYSFLVGLLGSPDWEIKVKESERRTVKETNSRFSFLSVGHRPAYRRSDKFSVFHRLGRAPGSPRLRFPPVAHSMSPPDQSFFYALDTPASSTQSSLGNLLPDSALVRLVSRNSHNQLAEESPGCLSKGLAEIPTPAHNSTVSPSSFNQPSPEIRNPPKVRRYTLLRRTPPIPLFLPIQTPPDSPILVEPKESPPSRNFVFHLHTPEPPAVQRRISHPYAYSQVDPSSSTSVFPRSPSQEFHTCDEQSPGPGPGHSSPASPSDSPMHRLLGKVTSNVKSLPPSLFVNASGSSPFFASTFGNHDPTIPRQGSASYTEDSLGGQSPTLFASGSTSTITGAKLVPFSASARASVVSESPSYTSEYAYQGGVSPTIPCDLEGRYDYVGPQAVLPVSGKTESSAYRNGQRQASGSSSDVVSYVGGSNLEPSSSGLGRKPSFCVPGALFPIPEEDTQAESSGSRSRSDPSSSFNGSVRASAAGSLPLTSSSSFGEFAVSFVSTSGFFRVANYSTPGASGAERSTNTATVSPPIAGTVTQTTRRGPGVSGASPPSVGTLRVGARESYPGSGDLNDGTETSGACMNGLYEELEEWGCEWILQNQVQQPGSSAGRTEVGTAL
ncbi:hypothetical protein BDM02DRAFT_3126265 [Thelephora ganbajun]|uniref:Uncharacterized protein n=1 Tax=Thelephora ganbajun TaxID=370292 RepID=A0ACB6ZSM8_THEGA|nr:hypothetical protein BDM02DRAFT_3126265 [Thelephora ganbajun]